MTSMCGHGGVAGCVALGRYSGANVGKHCGVVGMWWGVGWQTLNLEGFFFLQNLGGLQKKREKVQKWEKEKCTSLNQFGVA